MPFGASFILRYDFDTSLRARPDPAHHPFYLPQAYKAVGESNDIPLTYYQVNTGATMTLSELMQEFGCTRLVYSSSATVYGIPPVVPIPETTKLDAKSPYGRSKVMAETVLNDHCRGPCPVPELGTHLLILSTANPSTWKCISLRYFK